MADDSKKNKKDKKHFFKDFKAELKKVVWLTPKQLVNNTVAVITIVLIVALIVFVLDVTFEKINTHGIEKLKSIVHTDENEIENSVIDLENATVVDDVDINTTPIEDVDTTNENVIENSVDENAENQ